MAKVKLGLDTLTNPQVVALANTIVTRMTGNATFPAPNPTLAVIGGQATAGATKIATCDSLKAQTDTALADREAGLATLRASLALLAAHVESVSGGDPVKIQSAGMGVRAERSAATVPSQVLNLVLTEGDFPGTLDAAWDPQKQSRLNEIQTSPDPMTESSWTTRTTCTKSSKTIEGLVSGSKVWVRARANGSAGPGPWSDPAFKVVP